jgi:hypothetical protein
VPSKGKYGREKHLLGNTAHVHDVKTVVVGVPLGIAEEGEWALLGSQCVHMQGRTFIRVGEGHDDEGTTRVHLRLGALHVLLVLQRE